MKKGIHLQFIDAKATCACGNVIETKSNKSQIALEVCDKCHPFYNKGANITTAKRGAVEKFNRKYGKTVEEGSK